ncbi:hypothetical protein QBC99_004960 [Beijerinckia sp. GAS462]|nr:hypothetical protein [Beijerinckia sp. GAS462]SED88914.1 hypothetical protein SAMN05443249_5800 [Beijerinckia sp. 28-YEA-48]
MGFNCRVLQIVIGGVLLRQNQGLRFTVVFPRDKQSEVSYSKIHALR